MSSRINPLIDDATPQERVVAKAIHDGFVAQGAVFHYYEVNGIFEIAISDEAYGDYDLLLIARKAIAAMKDEPA